MSNCDSIICNGGLGNDFAFVGLMKFSGTYLVGLMCKLNEIIHGEHLAHWWVHRKNNTWELVFSDL